MAVRSANVGVGFVAGAFISYARDLRGRFTTVKGQFEQAHMHAAYEVAREMEEVLETKVARRAQRRGFPRRGSGELSRALLAEGNWRPDPRGWLWGFQVGIPEHLDKSPAKAYWRNLERGTGVFHGRQLLVLLGPGGRSVGLRDTTNLDRVRGPLAEVRNEIEGYRFLSEGASKANSRLRAGGMKRIYGLYVTAVPVDYDAAGFRPKMLSSFR